MHGWEKMPDQISTSGGFYFNLINLQPLLKNPMKIVKTGIYKFSIPMAPFTIATGTMDFAQNTLISIVTDNGLEGLGECSAFPMIVGETQNTCFEMAKEFASLWKGKVANAIEERMKELDAFTAFNSTIKSAFEMALFDLAAKEVGQPLYQFLGGEKKLLETDLTIGIDTPRKMARQAKEFVEKGVRIIKIKLGKDADEDIERVKQIRESIDKKIILRVDANQGWSFNEAVVVLQKISEYNIQFCEQPMRCWDDPLLPDLKKLSPIPIMADESVFSHRDADRLLLANSCSYVNIKFAKSGGILEATRINQVCEELNVPCMMGGMLESRLALTAFAHFATSHANIRFYDMDTCLLGHKIDPIIGGVTYNQFHLEIPDAPGIGAHVDPSFLKTCESVTI
jgi:L-alanine-DL-glutamate epimerase-like enolase superfamily enzyme